MKRILIVDEDLNKVEMTASVFKDEPGVQMLRAHDGDQAPQMAAACPSALVVLDVTLPGRDSFAVLRLLRRDRWMRNSKAILVAGMDGGGTKAITLNLGADGFMTTKLFSPFALLAKPAELLHLDRVVA